MFSFLLVQLITQISSLSFLLFNGGASKFNYNKTKISSKMAGQIRIFLKIAKI